MPPAPPARRRLLLNEPTQRGQYKSILTHVVPNIQRRLDGAVATTLARALLWAAFDDEMSMYVPAHIRNRIRLSNPFCSRWPGG